MPFVCFTVDLVPVVFVLSAALPSSPPRCAVPAVCCHRRDVSCRPEQLTSAHTTSCRFHRRHRVTTYRHLRRAVCRLGQCRRRQYCRGVDAATTASFDGFTSSVFFPIATSVVIRPRRYRRLLPVAAITATGARDNASATTFV
ncbi:hypothetical protein PHMEG_00041376, partial [Phytophthora megakarya]